MKRVKWLAGLALLLAVAVGWLLTAKCLEARKAGWVRLAYVYDGDTIAVAPLAGGDQTRVRLLGVDAPEVAHWQDASEAQAYGEAAKAALEAFLPVGSLLRLESDAQHYDRYGRALAYVWDEQGEMVNEWLLKNGWAREKHFKPNVRYRARLERAQESARRQGLGLWAQGNG